MNASIRRRGWILVECMTAVILAGVMVAIMVTAQANTAELNRMQLARQQCLAAAEAQLDSFTARGAPLDAAAAKALWPDVKIETRVQAGEGEWRGLSRVTAAATKTVRGVEIKVELNRYVAEAPR